MDRGQVGFWSVLAVLTVSGGFFAYGAEKQRSAVQAASAPISSGDTLRLVSPIDGDTVLMRTETGESVTVRLVGIKSFDRDGKDATSSFGQAAMDGLVRLLGDRDVRAEVHDPPLDSRGRALATLFVDDADMGLELVREGLVIVYTEHPFPSVTVYLEEQAHAQQARQGVWGNKDAAERAYGLAREWRARSK